MPQDITVSSDAYHKLVNTILTEMEQSQKAIQHQMLAAYWAVRRGQSTKRDRAARK